jgi:hypothetical protein
VLDVSWRLRAGGYTAELIASEPLVDLLRSVLVDLRTDDAATGVIEVSPNSSGSYRIRSDGRLWDDAVKLDDVGDEVVHMLLRAALDAQSSIVHVHAGAVALSDQTVVVGGWSGSGKSTAITALLSAGFAYITDERLAVAADGRSISGFPKPISLISGSFEVLAHLDPLHTGHGAANATTWQIPASTIGPIAEELDRIPSIVVFVAYRAGADTIVTNLSPVVAAARLVGDSPDVSVRGGAGVGAIASLAASVPCVEIEFGDLDEFVAAVRTACAQPPDVDVAAPVELGGLGAAHLPAPPTPAGVAEDRRYTIALGASVWTFGDGGALGFVEATGSVVELVDANAVWVQLLDGSVTLAQLIDEVADATSSDPEAVRIAARSNVCDLWSVGLIGPCDDA